MRVRFFSVTMISAMLLSACTVDWLSSVQFSGQIKRGADPIDEYFAGSFELKLRDGDDLYTFSDELQLDREAQGQFFGKVPVDLGLGGDYKTTIVLSVRGEEVVGCFLNPKASLARNSQDSGGNEYHDAKFGQVIFDLDDPKAENCEGTTQAKVK